MIPPGIRVVRGPNWMWQSQDGGEGHVGTVCEIGRYGSQHSPEKTVVVNWDSGHRTNYRVGYQNQYDLIIVDNAQVGVRHSNVVCENCSKGGIAGIVFKCAECSNYILCASCYGNDAHNLEHAFIRYTTPSSLGVRVPQRQGSTKVQLKGIFVGAKVVRGPDWEWGVQDGGEGKPGRVMEIRGWDNESCRSVANVSWTSGSTNVYRLGHKGNVDLKYVVPTTGGFYYKDHMPVLGQPEEQQPVVATVRPTFSVGDRVKVCLEVDALMKLQQGHGGWNPRMVAHLSKQGTVHRITEKGDIRVQYENCPNRWTFHPAALVKVCSFRVGDLVTIITDVIKVTQLQIGHGEWVNAMKHALGKLCKVIKVYSDGDLRIQQIDDGSEWTVNPKCVKLERSPLATAAERSNSMMDLSHERLHRTMSPLSGLSGTSSADKLVREAAQGHLDFVKQYLLEHPTQIDVMSGGKTCLQVAAHQGHVNIVTLLLNLGANVNIVDKEGDSVLHYAAFGNQPETMRILLEKGAEINFLNSSHCSALHICAHKKTPHCVKVLLEFGADVNIQDSYGDTALHDATGKENTEVIELLCSAPNLDFTVRNNRGFNVLHHASLKGNVLATKKILQLSRQLVNTRKDDGFAALHLAALNGHARVVEALVVEGQAEINIRNNRRQTPFLLAVSQGHAAAIEILVNLGCDISAKDEDGDNAMRLCVIKKTNFQTTTLGDDAPEILEIYNSIPQITEFRLMYALLCYLMKKGCRMEPNNKGNTVFEYIADKDLQDLILSYQDSSLQELPSSSSAVTSSTTPRNDDMTRNIHMLNLNETPLPETVNNVDPEMPNHDTPCSSTQLLLDYLEISQQPPPQPPHQNQSSTSEYVDMTAALVRSRKPPPPVICVDKKECIVCNEILHLIIFEPCKHQVCCEDCGIRMKKCISCAMAIEKKVGINGLQIVGKESRVPSADRLRYLENKIQEYEETHYCSICMERTRDVAFLCGHGACSRCADTLRTCHMCRKTIMKKINLY